MTSTAWQLKSKKKIVTITMYSSTTNMVICYSASACDPFISMIDNTLRAIWVVSRLELELRTSKSEGHPVHVHLWWEISKNSVWSCNGWVWRGKEGMESFLRKSLEPGGGSQMGKEKEDQWEWEKEDEIWIMEGPVVNVHLVLLLLPSLASLSWLRHCCQVAR